MKRNEGARQALLAELTVTVLFLAIVSAIALGVFASARRLERWDEAVQRTWQQGQNWLAQLRDTPDAEACLTAQGFVIAGDHRMACTADGVSWQAAVQREETPAGELTTVHLSAQDAQGNELASMAVTNYFSGEE